MDQQTRRRLIERYAGVPALLQGIVVMMTTEQLDRRQGGEWSAREVLHHLVDAELEEAMRLRRILAEDNPQLMWVDEAEFARRLHYTRPVETSLQIIEAIVPVNVELLKLLDEGEWQRSGTHSVDGRYSVEDWLEKMTSHPFDHASQLRRAAGLDAL